MAQASSQLDKVVVAAQPKPLNWRMPLVYFLLIFGATLTVIPFIFTFMSSFKSLEEIRRIPPSLIPENFTTENYETVLNDPNLPLLTFYRNSAIVALSNVAITLFTSALMGYIFAKFEFRGKQILFYYILSQLMIPFQVTMIPSYLILVQFGLLNNLLGLIIPSGINAFGIFLMRQFMLTVPNELMEAARVDGASEWRIFLQIVLPQVSPALATLGVLTFMSNWNAYLWPIIVLTEQRVRTLPIILQWYTTQNATQTNLSMAAAVLVMMPVLIVFVLLQRWIIRGISLTGLKG